MTGFPANTPSKHQQYKANAVEGASQLQLLVMLFDGSIRFLRQAKEAMGKNDLVQACESMLQAKAIVAHLLNTLQGGEDNEIAARLRPLYLFCYEQIIEGNLEKSPERLESVIRVLSSLRTAWRELALREKGPAPTAAGGGDGLYLSVAT